MFIYQALRPIQLASLVVIAAAFFMITTNLNGRPSMKRFIL